MGWVTEICYSHFELDMAVVTQCQVSWSFQHHTHYIIGKTICQ